MPRGRHRKPTNTARNVKRVGFGGIAVFTLAATSPTGTGAAPVGDVSAKRPPAVQYRPAALVTPLAPPITPQAAPFKLRVVSGDTLSELALEDLGLPSWQPLYEENRAVIGDNPDLILPGQELVYTGEVVDPPSASIEEQASTEEVVPVPEAPEPPHAQTSPDASVPFGTAPIINGAGPVSPRTQEAADRVFTQVRGASLITVGGTRSSARDPNGHPSGNALDYMVMSDKALGDAIVQYHIDNWDSLGVQYIIWQQRYRDTPEGPWRIMEDRGSSTQNHMDHPHVNYRP